MAGDPGIGKSTLLLAAAADAADHAPVLYVTGEESAAQVKLRADRLGIDTPGLYLLPPTGLTEIMTHMEGLNPSLVVIDSIQTVFDEDLPSEAGSMAQIRECARRPDTVGQVLRHFGGDDRACDQGRRNSRSESLEHVVDVVLYLEGDPVSSFRLLRSVKNRFGSTTKLVYSK